VAVYLSDGVPTRSPGLGSCALVFSSGSLRRCQHGELIDAHANVVRFNWAPVQGHESYAGSKVGMTGRSMAPAAMLLHLLHKAIETRGLLESNAAYHDLLVADDNIGRGPAHHQSHHAACTPGQGIVCIDVSAPLHCCATCLLITPLPLLILFLY
jgi:hypothetical protein